MRNVLFFLVLFLLRFPFASPSNSIDIDYHALLAEGKKFENNGSYDQAISTYLSVVEKYPQKPESYLELSNIYMKKGVNNIASYYLDLCLKYQDNFERKERKADLFTQEALFYQKLGDREKEEFFLKQLLSFTQEKLTTFFDKKNYAKASLLLAIFYLKTDVESSNNYLLNAITYQYKEKLAYMLLAGSSREKYEKNHSKENRDSFLFYYKKYNYYEFDKDSYALMTKDFYEIREKNDLFYDSIQKTLFDEMF